VLNLKKFNILFIVSALFVVGIFGIRAQSNLTGQTISVLNVRSGPSIEHPTMTQIQVNMPIIIEGRNRFGDWVLMHTADGTSRGWIATRFVNWDSDDVLLETIPVTNETLGDTIAAQPVTEATTADVAPATIADSTLTGSAISTLNVRTGDDTTNPAVGQLIVNTIVAIEGRNQIGNWLLIHTADNSIRGWVASRYINISSDIDISAVPVVGDVIAVATEAPAEVAPMMSGAEIALAEQLSAIPIVPTISGNAVNIYRRGIEQGRNPQHFIQIGDSNAESQAYLGLLGQRNYTLGSYGYLESTIDYFVGGGINSFTNKGQTAQSGNLTTTVIDPIFADPRYCPGTAPLDCELNRTNPSIAIIYLGAADRQAIDHETYYNALRTIVERSIANNVLPILTLMPTKPHPQRSQQKGMEFNMIMIEISRQYDIPLINMWSAVRDLPEYGMQNDLLHFTYGGVPFLSFTGRETQWGYTRWNLEVLKTLHALRQAAGV
jgi:uncharacterized protein YraI